MALSARWCSQGNYTFIVPVIVRIKFWSYLTVLNNIAIVWLYCKSDNCAGQYPVWSTVCSLLVQGIIQYKVARLSTIGIPTVEIKQWYECLISTRGFPILDISRISSISKLNQSPALDKRPQLGYRKPNWSVVFNAWHIMQHHIFKTINTGFAPAYQLHDPHMVSACICAWVNRAESDRQIHWIIHQFLRGCSMQDS